MTVYTCPVCNKNYSNQEKLEEHKATHLHVKTEEMDCDDVAAADEYSESFDEENKEDNQEGQVQ